MQRAHPIVISSATFSWPDGSNVLADASAVFGRGSTGLVGSNGSGKSTLLGLIAGELQLGSGTIDVGGRVATLRQDLALRTELSVADLLGVKAKLDALGAIEAGDVDPSHFDTVGDDWDIEERAVAELHSLGLGDLDLGRTVVEISGGEAVRVALGGLRLGGAPVVLLDEPTNNLDRRSRTHVHELISNWNATLVVVSHDIELLEQMEGTVELRSGSLSAYGGGYSAYRAQVDADQDAARQRLNNAEQALRKERRQRIEAETKLARRARTARRAEADKRMPKIAMHRAKGSAELSAGKIRGRHEADEARARDDVEAARGSLRSDPSIRIDLVDPHIAADRRLATLVDSSTVIELRGPTRMAIVGDNGAGKTRLVESMADPGDGDGRGREAPHAVAHTDRVGYLPQRIALDDDATVLELVQAAAPATRPEIIRSHLARFLLRGDSVQRRVATLSGGERFRVALARLLLADPAHDLIVLDEPTNDIDIDTVDALVSALSQYRGGLIVISHDTAVLDRLGIDVTVTVDGQGLHSVPT